MRFRVNAPHVISETIDGETVIIDLSTGFYYSVRDDDAGIWAALSNGCTTEEVVTSILRRFEASEVDVVEVVDELVTGLVREGLLVADAGAPQSHANGLSNESAAGRMPLRRPTLSKFTDMQDLVLLDPVHDVSQAGWPQQQGGAGDAEDVAS